jgi:hypothetical protein
VSGIFLPLRVNSLPLATIYEVKIPLRKWKNPLLQRNPAQMTWRLPILKWYGKSYCDLLGRSYIDEGQGHITHDQCPEDRIYYNHIHI